MESITRFEQMTEQLRQRPRRCRIAAVCPDDAHSQEALQRALRENVADVLMVGDTANYRPLAAEFPDRVSCRDASTPVAAATEAVAAVRRGEADLLFKGLIASDDLLRAILHKPDGLLPPGRVLTHIAVAQLPERERLLLLSDVAVIPNPTLPQRQAQIGYLADACRRLGISVPRVAMLHCTEKVSEKFPLTLDYQALKQEAAKGTWGDIVLDGPMDLTTACQPAAGTIKHIQSAIGGRADALLMPDIEAGNILYKALSLFGGARVAGILQGASCPVVLTSRGDSTEAKYNSLAFAALMAPTH